jgi:hypothetical protein
LATTPIPIMGGQFQTTAPTSAPGVVNPLSTNPTGAQGGSSTAAGAPVMPGGASASPMMAPSGASGAAPRAQGGSGSGTAIGSPTSTLSGLLGTQGSGTSLGSATGQNGQTVVNGQQTQRQDDRTLGELQSYYGEGMGSYIYSLMQNGGMNTNLVNSVDSSMIAAMQPQINQGQADLNSVLGAQGVSGDSSTSSLANSNYLSKAATAENSQIAQTYLGQYDQGQQLLQSILGGVLGTNQQGTANANNPMDTISGILGMGGSALNAAGDIGAAGGISGILSGLL